MKIVARKIAVAILCVMLAGGLLGCGQRQEFDASEQVQLWLDLAFKNDITTAGKDGLLLKKEANQVYEKEIAKVTDAFLSSLRSDYEVTEEIEEEFRELFKELFMKAKYTVGEARERADGSYVVSVMCEQVQLEEAFEAEYNRACVELYKKWKQFPASAPSSKADADKYVLELIRDGIRNGLDNITYRAPVEVEVTIEPSGNIREADTYRVPMELFDIF